MKHLTRALFALAGLSLAGFLASPGLLTLAGVAASAALVLAALKCE